MGGKAGEEQLDLCKDEETLHLWEKKHALLKRELSGDDTCVCVCLWVSDSNCNKKKKTDFLLLFDPVLFEKKQKR